MSAPQQQSVDITELPFYQLQSVRTNMEEELKLLTNSFGSLKALYAKFSNGMESLNTINSKNQGKPKHFGAPDQFYYLYVPGKMGNVKTVIVDIGTGYFVEKSVDDAKDFYKRKTDYLKQSIDTLTNTLSQKQKNYNVLMDVMQAKLAQIRAQGGAGAGGAATAGQEIQVN